MKLKEWVKEHSVEITVGAGVFTAAVIGFQCGYRCCESSGLKSMSKEEMGLLEGFNHIVKYIDMQADNCGRKNTACALVGAYLSKDGRIKFISKKI